MSKIKLSDPLETMEIGEGNYTRVVTRIKHLDNFTYSLTTKATFIVPLNGWQVEANLKVYEDGKIFRESSGNACEVIGSSGINLTNALENAETSAVGRACAFAGIGINTDIASADEVQGAKEKIGGAKSNQRKNLGKAAEDKALEKLTGKGK